MKYFAKVYLITFALTIIIGFIFFQLQPYEMPTQVNQDEIQNDDPPSAPQPTETPIMLHNKAIIWDTRDSVLT